MKKRPDRYWTLENTLKECRELVRQEGNLPPQQRMRRLGMSSLTVAIDKYGGFYKIRELLQLKDKSYERPKNYWTKERVLQTYRDLTNKFGYPPSDNELRENGYTGMGFAISNRYGGFFAIRKELGLESKRKPNKYWTREKIIETCRKIVEEKGALPSAEEFKKIEAKNKEIKGLSMAIWKEVGGLRKIRNILNLEQRAKEDLYWANKENILLEIKAVISKLGYLPSSKELYKIGKSSLAAAITKNYGMTELRKDLGLEVLRIGDWSEGKVLEECRIIVKKEGNLPSSRSLCKSGFAALSSQITKFGGYRYFRNLLGLKQNQLEKGYWQNKTNILIELKRIIMENGLVTMPNSSWLKKRGYKSLAAAISKYHEGFSHFRELLGEKSQENSTILLLETILEDKLT
jgi:hypothetical protein